MLAAEMSTPFSDVEDMCNIIIFHDIVVFLFILLTVVRLGFSYPAEAFTLFVDQTACLAVFHSLHTHDCRNIVIW